MKTRNLNKYGLEFAGSRTSKRFDWRQWLIDLIISAVAMALLWWLFSLVSRAATKGDVMPGVRAAGMPVAASVAITIVLVVVVAVLARLWSRSAAEREAASTYSDESWDPYVVNKPVPFEIVDPLAEGDTLTREQRAHEAMPEGLTRLNAALICFALAAEVRLIRELVRSARGSLGAEDYDDALTGAEDRLGKMRTRLWQLKAHFDGGAISESNAGELPKMYAKITAGGVS